MQKQTKPPNDLVRGAVDVGHALVSQHPCSDCTAPLPWGNAYLSRGLASEWVHDYMWDWTLFPAISTLGRVRRKMQNGRNSLTPEAVCHWTCSWTSTEAAGWSTGPPAFPAFLQPREHNLLTNPLGLGQPVRFRESASVVATPTLHWHQALDSLM